MLTTYPALASVDSYTSFKVKQDNFTETEVVRDEVAVNCPRAPSSLAEKWKILVQQISLYPCSILGA